MWPDSCLTATLVKAARCFPGKWRHRSACEIARVCPGSWKLHVLNLAGLTEWLAIVLTHRQSSRLGVGAGGGAGGGELV